MRFYLDPETFCRSLTDGLFLNPGKCIDWSSPYVERRVIIDSTAACTRILAPKGAAPFVYMLHVSTLSVSGFAFLGSRHGPLTNSKRDNVLSFFPLLVMSNRLLGIGGSSIVTAENDGKTVLKGYEAWDGDQLLALREENGCEKLLAKEDHVYRVLGEHPHILRCYGLVEVHPNVRSLRLERASYGNIREFIRNNKTTPLSEESRLNIALGVSSGIAYMHSKNIIHCNISCRNLLLFPDLRVKVCDFGSARIDENLFENYIVEEIRYELPLRGRVFEDCLYIKRKLFALGSTVYEIMAWGMPSEELGTDDVEKNVKQMPRDK
ncbi:hypothetical protein B7494_g7681 [Chlorociboria aeruginascens]|nr:hypothetical protein B7494_g7681 [Chlorociboria aeruginascens]